MVYRFEIGLKSGVPDARGRSVLDRADRALGLSMEKCRTRDAYKVTAHLSDAEADRVMDVFTDAVVAESARGRLAMAEAFTWCLEISYKAGVTDNVGRTARGSLQDLLGRELAWEEQVYTSIQYFVTGDLGREEMERLGYDWLANGLIQQVAVWSESEWRASEPDMRLPLFEAERGPEGKVIGLPGDDGELKGI